MSAATPRMRMFAGPNGSGKSVLKSHLSPQLLGVYLNPDEIEARLKRDGGLELRAFGVETTAEEVLPAFVKSEFLEMEGLAVTGMRVARASPVPKIPCRERHRISVHGHLAAVFRSIFPL